MIKLDKQEAWKEKHFNRSPFEKNKSLSMSEEIVKFLNKNKIGDFIIVPGNNWNTGIIYKGLKKKRT